MTQFCDQLLVLDQGKIAGVGKPKKFDSGVYTPEFSEWSPRLWPIRGWRSTGAVNGK